DFTVPGANGAPNASFQVLVEPDGTTGSYILFDKTTLQPLWIVNQAGQQINFSNGVITQTQNPLTPEMQQLIQNVFTKAFSNTDTNTKQANALGSSTPDSFQTFTVGKDGLTATAFLQNETGPKEKAAPGSGPNTGQPVSHVPNTLTLTSYGK